MRLSLTTKSVTYAFNCATQRIGIFNRCRYQYLRLRDVLLQLGETTIARLSGAGAVLHTTLLLLERLALTNAKKGLRFIGMTSDAIKNINY
jgi:hypothetical protein